MGSSLPLSASYMIVLLTTWHRYALGGRFGSGNDAASQRYSRMGYPTWQRSRVCGWSRGNEDNLGAGGGRWEGVVDSVVEPYMGMCWVFSLVFSIFLFFFSVLSNFHCSSVVHLFFNSHHCHCCCHSSPLPSEYLLLDLPCSRWVCHAWPLISFPFSSLEVGLASISLIYFFNHPYMIPFPSLIDTWHNTTPIFPTDTNMQTNRTEISSRYSSLLSALPLLIMEVAVVELLVRWFFLFGEVSLCHFFFFLFLGLHLSFCYFSFLMASTLTSLTPFCPRQPDICTYKIIYAYYPPIL